MYRIADSMGYFNRTNELLYNPHIGFQTFQRFNGDELHPLELGWTEGLPIEYQPYRGTLDNGRHPFTTVAYYRVYWQYFEPEEGQYNWALFDKALETAQERGQTLMIRLPPYGSFDWPGERIADDHDVPGWLRQRIGPKPFFPASERKSHVFLKNHGILDINDPAYVQSYSRAIQALAEHYDEDPRLDSVDICICGTWGEEADIEFLTEDNRNTLLHAYLDHFKNTPMLAQSNQSEVHSERYNVRKDVEPRLGVLRYIHSQGKRVGLRGDGLGDMSCRHDTAKWNWAHMRSIYPYIFGAPEVCDMWKRGPVSFEACGVMHDWLALGYDVEEIFEQALLWHTSTFSNKGSPVPLQYQSSVENWLKKLGYRFALRNSNFPSAAAPGDTLQISLWLENCGVAPIYRSYPFCLRLKGQNGSATHRTAADIRDWFPGDIIVNEDWALPENLRPGPYLLQAAIVDPRSGLPNVRFGCDAPEDEGYSTIGKIEIL